ncbi:2-deoxy-D-gluconate 3-dehydrogenase [Burkholderia ubonensis]|nr:2-deoxy-D-gluconate 3-dehydrogenase [Burkholderia ubonensis]
MTGGTSGIGAAIARRFADAGASVVALGLDADGAHVPIHPRVCCIELDVTDVDALSGTIASQLRLAALVNGVGISRDASEYRMDVFEHVLNTNPTPSTSRILP